MTEQADSKHVLRQYVAAVQAGDREAIRGMFAPDATRKLDAGRLPLSGTWAGRDTIIDEFLAKAMAHYEPGSVSLEITGMIAEGDRVVLQWTSRARTREGRPYENGCIGVFTIREGMIKDVREYMDTLYASEVAFAREGGRAGNARGRTDVVRCIRARGIALGGRRVRTDRGDRPAHRSAR
jgi:uncharacterized protein